ncbi:MAG: hypothetical protein IT210_05205 [Armatimonadetes bacterium]|nr:hypothetical protein [Armatimonadota bacterium]
MPLLILMMALFSAAAPAPEMKAEFDRLDAALNGGKGYSEAANGGTLAWGESYILMAYMDMFHATRDRDYLRRLTAHFDRMLKNRDDILGRADAYAGRPLTGWGSTEYSEGRWHVWIVHTGMILVAPAEFVRVVKKDKSLQTEFGAKAEEYRARIEESIRDADLYWQEGPGKGEGFYTGAHLKAVLPTNQQNSLGIVLLEMSRATGSGAYRDKASRLARYFKNRLRRPSPDLYDWAYWPRETEDGPDSEDISHAGANVTFAALCARDRIVFNARDMSRFAQTWLQKVKRPDGTWADTVAGEGKGGTYMPYSAYYWLILAPRVPKETGQALYRDAEHAFTLFKEKDSYRLQGVARLLRYRALADPKKTAGGSLSYP